MSSPRGGAQAGSPSDVPSSWPLTEATRAEPTTRSPTTRTPTPNASCFAMTFPKRVFDNSAVNTTLAAPIISTMEAGTQRAPVKMNQLPSRSHNAGTKSLSTTPRDGQNEPEAAGAAGPWRARPGPSRERHAGTSSTKQEAMAKNMTNSSRKGRWKRKSPSLRVATVVP